MCAFSIGNLGYSQNEPILSWLRKEVPEEVLEPSLPIVDPHHHLWDRRRDACKYRTIVYSPHELLEDLYDGHNVVATVFCQAKAYKRSSGPAELRNVTEVEFVQGVAAVCESDLYGPTKDSCVRACAGILGEVDLRHPKAAETLEAMMRCRNFRGIRGNGPFDEDFKRGFRVMEKNGLVFDIWHNPEPAYVPGELPKLTQLAKEFPNVKVVLNHLGGLVGAVIAGTDIEAAWRKELLELSKCQNVYCKVGGILMPKNGFGLDKREKPIDSAGLCELVYPWFSYAIDCFGPERCMFESNFPVDKESATYRTLWNAFKRVASKKGLSDAKKRDIFHDTAVRVYSLDIGADGSPADAKRQKCA
eukprot:TRINITY_DN33969_c0_g1_i2.p1 TRINITY_DN33969_c0_g1~~TRINITY_DN33969_c0_g1_i2.p1  ORF type:complete len:375 (-),score=56.69 TRINITY_DN33969_c0_g1_i2:121-1200(-)